MRRAALALVLLLSGPAAEAAPSQRPANAAEAARQKATDRDDNRAQARTAADEIVRLRQQLVALGAAETAGEKTVGDKGARLAALNAAEADLNARMGKNQAQLARLLGALQLYRRDPPPALLVSPKSATDAVNAAILIKAITPELERRAKAFAAEAKQLQTLRRSVVLANGALFAAQSDVADRRLEIERLIAEKTALQTRLDAGADADDADVKRLAAEARSLGQLVTGLDVRDSDAGQAAELRLTAPTPGPPVRRFNDPSPVHGRSEGWSWATAPGAVVLSPTGGRIDYAGPLKGWGLVLILRVSGGYHLVLAGLDAANAKIGSEVSAGEPIGRMARASTMSKDKAPPLPELYLEVRKGETPVDPARWLNPAAQSGR
jgi:septal ring factor EnvC (AmiA/AmiB activator)